MMTTQPNIHFTVLALASLSCCQTAFGVDLNITVTEATGGTNIVTVEAGATVNYEISGQLTNTDNEGLAGFAFDLTFTGGSLDSQVAPGPGMTAFDVPNGITSPAGFGGAMIGGFDPGWRRAEHDQQPLGRHLDRHG